MLPTPKGSRDLIKEINHNLVLNLIKSRGPVARMDLARFSGLSAATISGITADLIGSGLVQEVGTADSTGGRRPVLLRLNPQAGFVVGVKLMEHAVTSALTDLDAQVLHHRTTALGAGASEGSTPKATLALETVLHTIIDTIEETIAESGVTRSRVLGIGVGMAGLVDGEAGVCRYSPFFDWHDAQIAAPIARHFDLPVYLENDVNTLTIAEQWFGYGHGKDHFVVITVGRGIGAGLVLNGQLCRGALGGAGEIGHVTLVPDGPPCSCGRRGCLEALAADPAVLREVSRALASGERSSLAGGTPLTLDTIIAAAQAGDTLARRALADSGRWLGVGIAALVNILNPQLVIIGGEGLRAGDWRLEPVYQTIRAHTYAHFADSLEIIVEPSGDETWARGAACVVLGEMFKPPVHRRQSEAV